MRTTKLVAGAVATAAALTIAPSASAGEIYQPMGPSATFHDHIDGQGSSYYSPGDWGSCVNLPVYMDNVTSSITISNAKVYIYDDDDCTRVLNWYDRTQSNLWYSSDQAESVRIYAR